MRKRIAALALAAVLAFGLAACGGSSSSTAASDAGEAAEASAGVSGEFTGTATGMGEVSVTITLTDGVITACEVVGSPVIEAAGEEIVSANGAIDVVAGATITSDAVNKALAAALEEAGL